MALWLIVDGDMYDSQKVVKADRMDDVAWEHDLKWATLVIRLDDDTVNQIKELTGPPETKTNGCWENDHTDWKNEILNG